MSPFQALYGFPPPLISELAIPGPDDEEAHDFLSAKQQMLEHLKENLCKAHNRMKRYADLKQVERSFQVGDMVYLKMAPYKWRGALKLQNKYYGLFLILKKIGNSAYKLQFPSNIQIHVVFHVSQLKKHIGAKAVPSPNLPMVNTDGTIKTGPATVLQVRQIPRNNAPVVQWKIQWENLSPEDATWEDASSSSTRSQRFSGALPKLGGPRKNRREDSSMLKKGAMSGIAMQTSSVNSFRFS